MNMFRSPKLGCQKKLQIPAPEQDRTGDTWLLNNHSLFLKFLLKIFTKVKENMN